MFFKKFIDFEKNINGNMKLFGNDSKKNLIIQKKTGFI